MQPETTALRFDLDQRFMAINKLGAIAVPVNFRMTIAESATVLYPLGAFDPAPALDSLLRDMSELFPGTQIYAAFGQTEMSPVTCILLAQDAIRKLGSVGKVIPTVAARSDEDMNDVPVGEVGENIYCAEVENVLAGHPAIVPHRTAGAVQTSAGARDRRRVAAQPGWQSTQNGTARTIWKCGND